MHDNRLAWTVSCLALLLLGHCGSPDEQVPANTTRVKPASSRAGRVARSTGVHRVSGQRVRIERERISPVRRRHVRIAYRPGGWRLTELFEMVGRQAGRPILYDRRSRVRATRIELVCDVRIPRDRLFEWLQAVLSYQRLVLVPVGEGGAQWFCCESP